MVENLSCLAKFSSGDCASAKWSAHKSSLAKRSGDKEVTLSG